MRFPCLVLDHDDTVVNSTAVIHFPSFLAYLKQVRPGLSYTLDDYFRKNFDPGIIPLFKDELGFTDEELEGEYRFWQKCVATRVPKAYPGMREILERYGWVLDGIFAVGKNKRSRQCLHWRQAQSTGLCRFLIRISPLRKKSRHPRRDAVILAE